MLANRSWRRPRTLPVSIGVGMGRYSWENTTSETTELLVGKPHLNHALRPPLFSLQDALVVWLVLDQQLLTWLDRIVQLKSEKVLRVGKRFHDDWDDGRAHCDQRIVLLADSPSVRIGVDRLTAFKPVRLPGGERALVRCPQVR